MSLTDSLLLEGYRDPRDVWIALRSDGQKGSGTVDDPFNGGVVETSPLPASLSLVVGTDPREIIVTTASAHGYIEGDIVLLSGTRDATGTPAPSFDGPYQITSVGSNQFKCYLDFPTTTSLTGSAFAVKRIFRLDELLGNLTQTNVAFHFGPGVFETRGNAGSTNPSTQGWQVRPGWKIRGSGIDVTTLQLASSRGGPNTYLYLVVGAKSYHMHSDVAEYSEVSDMTLDCNAQGNLTLTVGALALLGSHTRVRRVRAINWGSQSLAAEAFVISLASEHPALPEVVDCVIEDCIAEHPGLNNVRESTIMSFPGTPVLPEESPSYSRGCVMRRNFVDATYSRNEVPIQSITLAGAVATVTTTRPHGRKAGNWVVIAGAIVDGTELNNFNGSYKISENPGDVTDTTFKYTPQPSAPASNPVGTMFVDRFSSHFVLGGSNSIVKENTITPGADDNQYRLTTLTPHNRIEGDNVVISGVYVAVVEFANAFNDAHRTDHVLSPTELTFTVHPTAAKPTGTIQYGPHYPQIGVDFHMAAGGGTCQIVEDNCVIGPTFAIYADSFSTRTLHVRNNHFHSVRIGVFRNLGYYLSPYLPPSNAIAGSCLTYSFEDGQHIATFTTIEPHGLSPGAQVTIGGAFVPYFPTPIGNNPYASDPDPTHGESYNPNNPYNGQFTVSAVSGPNQFQCHLPRAPVGYGTSPNVPTNAEGAPVFSPGATLNVVTASSLEPVSAGSKMAKFISQGAHGFDDGEIVSVFGVKMDAPGGGTFFNPYNGVFDITKTSPTEFTYLMASAPSSNALTSPAPMCAKQVGTALTRNGTTATFRTVRPHFLERGQIVSMEGALVGGSAINPFNGKNFAITSVGLTSFTYEMSGVPTTHAYGSASYRGKDIEGLLHIENNVFELFANPDPIGLPVGAVSMGGGGLVFPPNYVFRQVAIRGNLVRHEDTAQDMANKTTAFGFFNAGAVLIEDNVIALSGTTPILFDVSAMTSCANNLTPQGTLIPAYDLATGRFTEAYFPAAEEAMVLAML